MPDRRGQTFGNLVGVSAEQQPAPIQPMTSLDAGNEEIVPVVHRTAGRKDDGWVPFIQEPLELRIAVAGAGFVVERKSRQFRLARPISLRGGEPVGKQSDHALR